MCGISGIFDFENRNTISEQLIHRMNESIIHRGPDDEGIYAGPGIGLGFRRLSIIDLSTGHQPICNEHETIWVMLNGEIYNYPELRRKQEQRGHRFRTHSDTETIVHLYEDYGEACFSMLRGMFAIAIWDARERKLILARDRVGKKPLYYAADTKRILFGSELKVLLAADSLSREIDPQALSDYFSFGYIPAPKTIYRCARKVLPGHYLVATTGGISEHPYWNLSFSETEERNETEWSEILRQHLCEATRIRLMSDVPLGAFLSGGIDSSAVVAMMSRLMQRPVTTCSIGFHEREYNESDYASQVAKKFHTDHHLEFVQPKALDILNKLVWHYDEPFADSSAIPTYYVSKVARQNVTVALGGDGGDENLAGYRRYYFYQLENQFRRFVPSRLRRPIFSPLASWCPALTWAPRVFRPRATFQSLSRSPLESYFNSISIFRPEEKSRLLSPDYRKGLNGYDSMVVLQEHYDRAETDDLLSRIQYVDIKTYLPDDILTKIDRASMAVSLEVRAPLLDHKLMESMARMPSSMKLHGRSGKSIFKKAMTGILPDEILRRNKQGFTIPVAQWFRGELKDVAHSLIFSSNTSILDRSYLERIWDQHQKVFYDHSAQLWTVLMFRKWQDAFHI